MSSPPPHPVLPSRGGGELPVTHCSEPLKERGPPGEEAILQPWTPPGAAPLGQLPGGHRFSLVVSVGPVTPDPRLRASPSQPVSPLSVCVNDITNATDTGGFSKPQDRAWQGPQPPPPRPAHHLEQMSSFWTRPSANIRKCLLEPAPPTPHSGPVLGRGSSGHTVCGPQPPSTVPLGHGEAGAMGSPRTGWPSPWPHK